MMNSWNASLNPHTFTKQAFGARNGNKVRVEPVQKLKWPDYSHYYEYYSGGRSIQIL